MASHTVLKEQLTEMGFDDRKITRELKRLGSKATIESAIEALELAQNRGSDDDEAAGGVGTDDEEMASDKTTSTSASDGQNNGEAGAAAAAAPETEAEREAKRLLYEEKIKQRRIERAAKEKEEALKREVQRRQDGKGMGKMKEELEQLARIRAAEEMRREKAEEKRVRDAVLQQIAADREEHRRRAAGETNSTSTAAAAATTATVTAAAAVVTPTVPKDGKCRLAIRMLDGQQLINEFDAREQLSAVRVFVYTRAPVEGDISFVMPPNRAFNDDDMEKPLSALGLCPSARVHVIKR
ncbi:UBX domain-containing protein 1-A-like [Oppia nitens]|uniref:UBX domain-containing protein 1-A-like n=1 Tax=Oppia nitens TaxID=1686743 RepID=UPI0023DC21D5|nr:UBX domain-containing protein 1-A-like [Oppia nitens]